GRLAVDFDPAGVRPEQRVHVLEQHALARAAAAEDDERLPGEHVEGESPQHGLAPEGLLEPGAADVARGGHVSRKSLVRKKSETSTVIEAATTVAVVARPTPSAPPVVPSPLRHARVPRTYARTTELR